ncbi:uncharacterized protein LOC143806358 isoform X1 [Ranitomeya variabilis]|uniref:uncharacterized protein LOC143806358 isoform X1 n=1 Tax=Ranitomeya variabilis TaxID=490064 RepID=UPI004057901F
MAGLQVFILCAAVFTAVSGSHMQGGTISFKATEKTQTGWLVDFTYKSSFIDNYGEYFYWNCFSGDCGHEIHHWLEPVENRTLSPSRWFQYEGYIRRRVDNDKPFQLWESSCCWVYNMYNANGWQLTASVDLGIRSDTLTPNSSPVTTIIPILRIPRNCATTINLLGHDPDGDPVSCRYGYYYGECSSCSSSFYVDNSRCTLFVPSSMSSGSYVVELILEDFPKNNIYLTYKDGTMVYKYPNFNRKRRELPKDSQKYYWYWSSTPYYGDYWTTESVTDTETSVILETTTDMSSVPEYSTTDHSITEVSTLEEFTLQTLSGTVYEPVTSAVYETVSTAVYETVTSAVSEAVHETVTSAVYGTAYETVSEAVYETLTSAVSEAVHETVSEAVHETVTSAVSTAVYETVTSAVSEAVHETVTSAVSGTVYETVSEAVYETVTSAVSEAVYETVTSAVSEAVHETVTSAVTGTVYETVSEAVYETVTSAVSETVYETVTSAVSEAVHETVTSAVSGTVYETVSEAMYETVTSAVSEAVHETVTSAVSGTVYETVSEAVYETVTSAVSEAVHETVTSAVSGTVYETVSEAVYETVTSAVSEAVHETVTSAVTETITEIVTEAMAETSADIVTDTVTETSTSSAIDFMTESMAPDVTTDMYYPSYQPPSMNSLSKISLQFLVEVTSSAPSCTLGDYRPKFVSPTPHHGEKLLTNAGSAVRLHLSAQAAYESISDFLVSGPSGLTKSFTGSSRSTTRSMVAEWTPSENDVGDHIPFCFVAETYGGYQSEMRCVIAVVGPNHLDNMELTCHENTMTLIVGKSSDHELYENQFRLNDPQCLVSSNSTHLIASVAYNSCGTETEETEDAIVFKNQATSFSDMLSVITRLHGVSIPFNCSFPKKSRVSASFRAHKSDYVFTEAGFGKFTYKFQFYTDDRFVEVETQFPLEATLRELLYMEIQVSASVPNVQLFVESCKATPHDNPSDPTSYDLIQNGCIKDETLVVYSANSTVYRFAVEAFAFIGDYSEVYMSCTVILCKLGETGTRCSHGCIPKGGANRQRHRRSVTSESQQHFISQGPVRMKRQSPSDGDHDTSASLNVNTLVISVSGAAVVTSLGFIVYIYIKRVRFSGYNLLKTQDF